MPMSSREANQANRIWGRLMSSINSPSNLPKTILVVDDEPDLVDLSAEFLVAEGYRVVKANDGAEAISLLEKDNRFNCFF